MIIGTCSLCGGPVETPDAWLGTLPAPATCKHCGAVRPQHGPVIDMRRPEPVSDSVLKPGSIKKGDTYSYAIPASKVRSVSWNEEYQRGWRDGMQAAYRWYTPTWPVTY